MKNKLSTVAQAASVTDAIAHNTRAHAILSASGSGIWLACTPAARLNENVPERGDKTASKKGTLCHEATESCLRRFLGIISQEDHVANIELLKTNELWEEEMGVKVEQAFSYGVACITNAWADFGKENVTILLEQRIDFSKWVQEGFGAADLVILTPDYTMVLDWKFGIGKVYAQGNSQMRLYGAGAHDMYGVLYGAPKVIMTIVQPFLDSIETEELDTDVLLAWMEDYVAPRAAQAWAGKGEFNPGQKQCQWCKVRGTCRARAEMNLAVAGDTFTLPALMTEAEVASTFMRIAGLRSWCNDVEEHVKDLVIDKGQELPGLKVVAGKSNRFITDPAQARTKLLAAGWTLDDIAEPLPAERKLLGLTALEKTVGKKVFTTVLGDLVVKPEGKPEVVAVTDPREAMQARRTSPEQDFD